MSRRTNTELVCSGLSCSSQVCVLFMWTEHERFSPFVWTRSRTETATGTRPHPRLRSESSLTFDLDSGRSLRSAMTILGHTHVHAFITPWCILEGQRGHSPYVWGPSPTWNRTSWWERTDSIIITLMWGPEGPWGWVTFASIRVHVKIAVSIPPGNTGLTGALMEVLEILQTCPPAISSSGFNS